MGDGLVSVLLRVLRQARVEEVVRLKNGLELTRELREIVVLEAERVEGGRRYMSLSP